MEDSLLMEKASLEVWDLVVAFFLKDQGSSENYKTKISFPQLVVHTILLLSVRLEICSVGEEASKDNWVSYNQHKQYHPLNLFHTFSNMIHQKMPKCSEKIPLVKQHVDHTIPQLLTVKVISIVGEKQGTDRQGQGGK